MVWVKRMMEFAHQITVLIFAGIYNAIGEAMNLTGWEDEPSRQHRIAISSWGADANG
jgi:hypothetical protein